VYSETAGAKAAPFQNLVITDGLDAAPFETCHPADRSLQAAFSKLANKVTLIEADPLKNSQPKGALDSAVCKNNPSRSSLTAMRLVV
jgi:hypothetical protein